MPFFEIAEEKLKPLTRASLSDVAIRERRDLQRLLRAHLPELLPDALVISEEFGDWEESKRRIDLLGVDRTGALVVIELKRGDTWSYRRFAMPPWCRQ
jgi:RecB family endonuclease NucS